MPKRPQLRLVPDADVARSPIQKVKGSRPKPCLHEHVEVDPRERRVTCVDCQVEVDPYEALDMLARSIDRFEWARDSARNEATRYQRELANLKRLESNAKARVRNAIRSLPECACEPQPYSSGRFCRECGGRVTKR